MSGLDLLQALWGATLAAGIASALLLILPPLLRRRFGSGVAYATWWLLPATVFASLLPDWSAQATDAGVGAIARVRHVVESAVVLPAGLPVATSGAGRGDWIVWFWLGGALSMALWLFACQRRYERSLGPLRPVRDDLWRSSRVEGLPALVGVVRPRIVLPDDFEVRYDANEQRLMLEHERCHRRRGDHIANLLMAVAASVFWFNPLLHLAAIRFRRDQELACDEAVIAAHPRSRRAYGEAMLKTLMAGPEAPLGCHWRVSHPLKERVMQLKSPMPPAWMRKAGLAVVSMFVSGAAFAFWSGQPVRAGDGEEGVRFDIVATRDEDSPTRDRKALARSSLWVPYGQQAIFELGDDMRIIGSARPPRAGTDRALVRGRFEYRDQGQWRTHDDDEVEMSIGLSPSYERLFDNGVHVVLMPRRANRPVGDDGVHTRYLPMSTIQKD